MKITRKQLKKILLREFRDTGRYEDFDFGAGAGGGQLPPVKPPRRGGGGGGGATVSSAMSCDVQAANTAIAATPARIFPRICMIVPPHCVLLMTEW